MLAEGKVCYENWGFYGGSSGKLVDKGDPVISKNERSGLKRSQTPH